MLYRKNVNSFLKQKKKKKIRQTRLPVHQKYSQSFKKIVITIPFKWSVLILKDLDYNFYTCYLFSNQHYFKVAFLFAETYLNYCWTTNSICVKNKYLSNRCTSWNHTVNWLLYLSTSFFFIKLKFKGKGYYIYKNFRNTIAPQFGYYHKIYVYSFFNKVKFLSKTKVLLFGLVKNDLLLTAYTLKSKRSINIFTGRGVRFARQIVYKKTGKVSSYR